MTSNITIFSNCLIICLWLGNVSYTPAKSIEVRIQWDRNAEYLYCIFLTFKTHAVFCFQCFSERQLTLEDINDIMEHFLFGSVESTDFHLLFCKLFFSLLITHDLDKMVTALYFVCMVIFDHVHSRYLYT